MNLRDQLLAIRDQHGKLTPALVVDVARDKTHPLHPRFEWDNKIAGESWRQHQAHELIRSVRVVRPATEALPQFSVRAFYHIESPQGHVYEPLDEVVAEPLMMQLVMREMERDWRALYGRYERFQEFIDMVRQDIDPPLATADVAA